MADKSEWMKGGYEGGDDGSGTRHLNIIEPSRWK